MDSMVEKRRRGRSGIRHAYMSAGHKAQKKGCNLVMGEIEKKQIIE